MTKSAITTPTSEGIKPEIIPQSPDLMAALVGDLATASSVEVRNSTEVSDEALPNGFEQLSDGIFFLPVRGGFKTNIPPTAFTSAPEAETTLDAIFTAEDRKVNVTNLPAAAFDKLVVGRYTASATFANGDLIKQATITVYENGTGKYFTVTAQTNPNTDDPELVDRSLALPRKRTHFFKGMRDGYDFVQELPRARGLDVFLPEMVRLFRHGAGYDVVDDAYRTYIVSVPTPETIKKAASDWGVDVKLVAESKAEGEVPVLNYVQAFAEGAYPIGVGGRLDYYTHDIGADHFLGVLASPRLLELLQPLAVEALARGTEDSLKDAGRLFDGATMEVRKAFLEVFGNPGTAEVTIKELAQSVHELASEFGVPFDSNGFVGTILEDFKSTGAKLGWADSKQEAIQHVLDQREEELRQEKERAIVTSTGLAE